jgi:hypothetical protein
MLVRSRIINVKRKPTKCPICGERVVDIIYGTGIMTEIDFALEYRKEGIMGGDNIPRRPPIWAYVCGCLRFRKVNPDGTDASVKVIKLLKNTRKAPASVFTWESEMVKRVLQTGGVKTIYHYKVTVTTELGENEILSVAALSGDDALNEAERIISLGATGLKGRKCASMEVFDNK